MLTRSKCDTPVGRKVAFLYTAESGEQGVGSREWGAGGGELGVGRWEWGAGSGEWGEQ